MTWHLWQIKTMAGDFYVNEKRKDVIVHQVQDRDALIILPDGESFAAHQFLAALKSDVQDPDWNPPALPPAEPEPELTQEQRDANSRRLAVIRDAMAKPKSRELTPLQKELRDAPQDERATIIRRHMDAAAKATAK